MVIILPTVTIKKPRSIGFRMVMAFLLIIGLSFLLMAGTLTNMLSNYLFRERIRQDRAGLEKWAVQTASSLYTANSIQMNASVLQASGELGGRLLLLDADGKIHVDSFGLLNGTRLSVPEVVSILVGGKQVDYGVHEESGEFVSDTGKVFNQGSNQNWTSLSSAGIVFESEVIGVLVLLSSVSEMMNSLYTLQTRMTIIFVVVATAAIISGMVFSGILTRPIGILTKGIQRMGRGDFSARVPETGSGEIKQMAQAFNSMSGKLESMDKTRNQFVSDASHELKTPLATMKIMIESLIYQPDMEEGLRTEFLSDVNKEIDRLSAIVGDLLTLVRADGKSVKLDRSRMFLSDVVEDAAHRLRMLADKKSQTLNLELHEMGEIYADKARIDQVVYNLMENAVKYTQEGGTITVTLTKQGREAQLTIEDNGPGIPEDNLTHVFERFYRVDKARGRESGGTGLGLAIAQQMINLHSGTIQVESEEGKGTKFIVLLPLNKG
ncbi:MAG: ATP-binding protein [Christensenellales bacterium]